MAEDSPAQYGFLRQISADTALKSFAMRQRVGKKTLKRAKLFLDSINKQRLYFIGSLGFDKLREI